MPRSHEPRKPGFTRSDPACDHSQQAMQNGNAKLRVVAANLQQARSIETQRGKFSRCSYLKQRLSITQY
jgi:hypothetical protein